jgi:trk system potassium uptake protein TrkH
MKLSAIAKIIGIFLILFSTSMLPPVVVDIIYHQHSYLEFLTAFFITLLTGLILWLPFQGQYIELRTRDGFLIVVLFWIVLSMFGALPFILSDSTALSFTNGLFESMSGLTTTGASVITNLDTLPNAMLFYRQEIQFFGGMGIIVLAVAVLPILGIGGMQLVKAETPGPIKDTKLTPRIQETAKTLWYIYVGLVALSTFFYWLCGMSLFNAIGESFATVSTGGFSMHSTSFGYYASPSINTVGIVFMLLGSINFGLHYLILQKKSLLVYFRDVETRTYFYLIIVISLIVFSVLAWNQYYENKWDIFIDSMFNVVSIISTTGFITSSFPNWPLLLGVIVMMAGIIGGCSSSTSGGMKVIRFLLLNKQSLCELRKLIHPRAIYTVKFGNSILPDHVIQAIWGFISAYTIVLVMMVLLLLANNINLPTAFGATVASLSNVGAGIGDVALDFAHLNNMCKWVLIVGMLLGRLEIFTVLVLFLPEFWRR